MRSWKDIVNEREMRRTGGMPERASFHSKGYHRYFEGYSEYKEIDADGKTHIRRVYTGVYRKADMSDRKRRQIKGMYVLLWLLGTAGFIFLITRDLPGNTAGYVVLPTVLSVLCLFWMMWSLFNYVTAGARMTMGEFRYTRSVEKSAAAAAVMQAVTAAAMAVHGMQSLSSDGKSELLCALGMLLCCCAALAVHKVETNISYDSVLSETEAPSLDARQISSD